MVKNDEPWKIGCSAQKIFYRRTQFNQCGVKVERRMRNETWNRNELNAHTEFEIDCKMARKNKPTQETTCRNL